MAEQVSPIKLSLAPMAPEIEAQLFNSYLRPITGNALRSLYEYLTENLQKDGSEELAGLVPLVSTAVQIFRSEDYAQAFQRTYLAYRYLTVLRSQRPEMPGFDLEATSNSKGGGTNA